MDDNTIIAKWNKKKLVDIGNSRGIRIPKEYIKELELENGISITVTKNEIIIRKLAV